MDYQEYKKEFLESLRNDSAINGTDTEDEFLNRTLSLLVDYDEVDDPVRFGMGDKRGRGNRLMRADGYCFDETDHSLILFISDFQDSENLKNSPFISSSHKEKRIVLYFSFLYWFTSIADVPVTFRAVNLARSSMALRPFSSRPMYNSNGC